jgi:hypothetical protein
LAGITAGMYLNITYDSELDIEIVDDINSYLTGYIFSELDYSGGDPELTAQVLTMDINNVIDEFTKTEVALGLKDYMSYEYVEANEWFACVWGLASESQPMLLDLYEAMAAETYDEGGLTKAKLYALMSLIEIGDLENAKTYFNELVDDYTDGSGSTGDRKMDAILMMAASRLELV